MNNDEKELYRTIDNLDYKSALVFITVVNAGSLKSAADILGYSLPSTSLLLKRYREKNKCVLFTRVGRNLVPTEEAFIKTNEITIAFKYLVEKI